MTLRNEVLCEVIKDYTGRPLWVDVAHDTYNSAIHTWSDKTYERLFNMNTENINTGMPRLAYIGPIFTSSPLLNGIVSVTVENDVQAHNPDMVSEMTVDELLS